MSLPTNYKDDVLNADVNTLRKYRMINNPDGTVSFEDVTNYTTNGTQYGANDVNKQNRAINSKVKLNGSNVDDINFSLSGNTLNITTS